MIKNVEIDEEEDEKKFKKLLRDTKHMGSKKFLKSVDDLNPNDFILNRDLVKTTRRFILSLVIEIFELRKQRDEMLQILIAYQNKY